MFVLHCGRKDKSSIVGGLSPKSQPLQTNVNPLHELAKISHELFNTTCTILRDEAIFGVDNAGVPLYIAMQDVLEIIQGNQLLNIVVIHLWMM